MNTRIPQSIVEARSRLMVRAIFFSSILYGQSKLQLIEPGSSEWGGIGCPTAMTDGYNLIVNVDFMNRLTIDERVFVFAHEVWHIMAMHPKRMRRYATEGLFNMVFLVDLFQICADAVINKCLVDSNIGKRPDGCVWIEKIGSYVVTGLEMPEDLYKLMIDQLPPSTKKLLEEANREEGEALGQAIVGGIPGGTGGVLSKDIIQNSPDKAAEHVNEAEMKAAVVSAHSLAKSQGTMPAGLKRFIDEFLESQVSWEEHLRLTFIATAGKESSTWSKPNKRKLIQGIYLPRRRGIRCGPVASINDTSGSVSMKEHQQYMGEQASILGDVRPEKLYLIWCDARVDACIELQDPEELQTEAMVKGALGGGGTSFLPPFEYLRDNEIEVETAIYFTDGYGPFPSEDLVREAGLDPDSVIWCISSDVVAPFGQTIRITY